MRVLCAVVIVAWTMPAMAEPADSWSEAKNLADDHVYFDHRETLYCAYVYTSNESSTGGGKVDMAACGLDILPGTAQSVPMIEWEHIFAASLMPARQMGCWDFPERFDKCVERDGDVLSGRACCEHVNSEAMGMIFDLHSIAPGAAQINQYRLNNRYGEADESFETWGPNCGARDQGGSDGNYENWFEPPNAVKGDVARVWLYMHDVHGVVIPDEEWEVFRQWSACDPVDEWEIARHLRISETKEVHNHYVAGAEVTDGAWLCVD